MTRIFLQLGVNLNLRANSLSVINWWVDVSFATHNDCRTHSGGVISLGAGSITIGSRNQKINGRISTDNNIIGDNDIMGTVLCTPYFIQGEGYTVERSIMFQDNHSTMRLMLNGKKSILKNTKHCNVRYFFVKDVVNRE